MMSAVDTVAAVFQDNDWVVWDRERIALEDLAFDIVSEADTGVVFCRSLPVEDLSREVGHLTSQIAAVTRRRAIGAKVWEGYLLLLCSGDLAAYDRVIQAVQHDLSYCRKIIVAAEDINNAVDPYAKALRFVSFLFPLKRTTDLASFDVRVALVEELINEGVPSEIASPLVAGFDEPSCQCALRLGDRAGGGEIG